jgi:preprotein translocase subunit SecD
MFRGFGHAKHKAPTMQFQINKLSRRSVLAGAAAATSLLWATAAAAQSITLEVVEARVVPDQRTQQAVLTIRVSEASREALSKLTQANVGRTMELRLDNFAFLSAIIREPITGASLQISGHTEAELRTLAERLLRPPVNVQAVIVG